MDYRGRTSATLDSNGAADTNERSIGDLLKDIAASIQQIVRSEIRLARMELTGSARRLRSSALMLAGGALFGIFGIAFILLAAMFALEIVLPAWLSALIVGVIALMGASVGFTVGRERMKTVHAPEQTIQTVKEDFQWMKEQVRS